MHKYIRLRHIHAKNYNNVWYHFRLFSIKENRMKWKAKVYLMRKKAAHIQIVVVKVCTIMKSINFVVCWILISACIILFCIFCFFSFLHYPHTPKLTHVVFNYTLENFAYLFFFLIRSRIVNYYARYYVGTPFIVWSPRICVTFVALCIFRSSSLAIYLVMYKILLSFSVRWVY